MLGKDKSNENNLLQDESRLLIILTRPLFQLILALVSLGMLVFYASALYFGRAYDGMYMMRAKNTVAGVVPDSPVDRAGIKVGDVLLSIGGRKIDPQLSTPAIPPGAQPGSSLIYTYQRGGQVFSTQVTLSDELSQDTFQYVLIVCITLLAFIFWGIGLLLCLFTAPLDLRARLVGLGLLCVGALMSTAGSGEFFLWYGALPITHLLWPMVAFTFLAAHLYFPRPSFPSRWRKIIVHVAAGLALLLMAAAILDDLIYKSYRIKNSIYLLVFLLSLLSGIGLLVHNFSHNDQPGVRRQIGIILTGTLLGFIPFLVLTLIPTLLFGPYPSRNLFSVLFFAFIPLAYAYIIFQKKLLKIDLAINRTFVFLLMALSILLPSYLALATLMAFLHLPPQWSLAGGLIIMGIALPSAAIQKRMQKLADQILYGNHYDHESVLSDLSGNLVQALDRKVLTRLLTENLPGQMKIEQIRLLFAEEGYLRSREAGFEVLQNDPLCQKLLMYQKPIRVQDLWGQLQPETAILWQPYGWGQVFAPIIFEKVLYGVLILGSRSTGDLYSNQDLRIIQSVAEQAALAIANIQLLETLRGLNQQMVRNDEAQRKAIVREMHDALLQPLIIVKQKILSEGNAELADKIDEMIGTTYNVIRLQRPSMLDGGIIPALGDLVEEMNLAQGQKGVRIVMDCQLEQAPALDDETLTAIYRIAQEALANALRHAEASIVQVSLQADSDRLLLRVEDDGKGFQPQAGNPEQQYGLLGMQERASMIGGLLEVLSQPGQGTVVSLSLCDNNY